VAISSKRTSGQTSESVLNVNFQFASDPGLARSWFEGLVLGVLAILGASEHPPNYLCKCLISRLLDPAGKLVNNQLIREF